MGAISRRSFVSSAVSGAGAALGAGALAGFAGAGALGALPGLARPASAAEPPEGAVPVELDATVAVGGATFGYPSTCWSPSPDLPEGAAAKFDIVEQGSGQTVGSAVFTVGSPAEAVSGGAWYAQNVFDGLMASEMSAGPGGNVALYGFERLDRDGVEMGRALRSCATSEKDGDGRPMLGWLYMALAHDWTLIYLEISVCPESFDAITTQTEAVWNSAVWPAAIPEDQAEGRLEDFRLFALERVALRNRLHPYCNPYWEVSDVAGIFGSLGDPGHAGYLMPRMWSYKFSTPDGIEESRVEHIEINTGYGAPSMWLWAMHRTDSDGTEYLRSTAEVEGYGVVDIAHYDYSSFFAWYVASNGTPILPEEAPHPSKWVVFSGWNGEPWQRVVGG